MLTLLKLGGSLITDKRESQHFHADVMHRAAQEIAQACAERSDLRLVIGHGSGSFGHIAAEQHGTMQGVHSPEQWRGFAEVATIARRLNALVIEALFSAQLPIFGVQPSASARCENGHIVTMALEPIQTALKHGLIPIVHGDVAIDSVRGGTIISTESIMAYLAQQLGNVTQIMLVGDVEGVFDTDGAIIPCITPSNYGEVAAALGSSRGVDVTGGMASKVRWMLDLVEKLPGLEVRIFGGSTAGQLRSALAGHTSPGTVIKADA